MKYFLMTAALISSLAFAQDDGAFLDAKYPSMVHPKINPNSNLKSFTKNDVEGIISFQTPVRAQFARGTCSIFSATAILEGLLIKKGKFDHSIDLSEEWLQYTAVRNKSGDGSSAWTNFGAIAKYGMPLETTMPYIGEDWTEVENPLKEIRCGHLISFAKKSCFIVHRDPSLLNLLDLQILTILKDEEFVAARKEALKIRNENILLTSNSFMLNNTNEIKNLLQSGTPLILEVDFYYGAWNHRKSTELGIGRNMAQWSQGIVSSPEPGSVDLEESAKHPAGHSILVVGYDDNIIVKKKIKMTDGTSKTFTYKGVYYFKNSWGADSFGENFELNGVKYPGYGMMVQKYAHEQGQFFVLPLK